MKTTLKPISQGTIYEKLSSKGAEAEFYTLPFQTVRNGNGIIKITDKFTMSVESFQEMLPAITSGRCYTLEELYYAHRFRGNPVPISIDDPMFLANLIINKAYDRVRNPCTSIFCNEILLKEAKRIAYDRIQRSSGVFTIDVSDEELNDCISSLVSFADDEYVDEFGMISTQSFFTKNSFIKSIKAIQASIEADPSRVKIFIGDPGTGKSYQGIHTMGDEKILVISLSNVVAAHIVSRAAEEGFENYEFWSYSKARYMLAMKPESLDFFEGFILEESSMLSCTELSIVLNVLNTMKPVCILGDNAQLPGFLGVGNLLNALITHYPELVTELTFNHRAAHCPDIVQVFSSFKRSGKMISTKDMPSVVTSNSLLSKDNQAISTWLNDVKNEVDTFACAFRNDDVIAINNLVLSNIFHLKSKLETKNNLYESKLNVYSELATKGKSFEVICTKNIKTETKFKAFNGERFTATFNGDKYVVCSKQFSKHRLTLTIKQLALSFDLGYAMTIHKLQGSEASSVLYYEPKLPSMLNPANLRYVGLSRAKVKLYIAIDRTNHPVFNEYNDIITEANLF